MNRPSPKEESLASVEQQVPPRVHRGRLFVAACAGLALFGVTIVLLGTLFGFPAMAERLRVDMMRLGALASLLITGVWTSTVALGPLIDRFGNKVVLASSSFMVAVSLMAFAGATSFAVAAVVCVFLGLGGAGLNMATNTLVSDLYEDERGSMLNYLGMSFSLGALALPLFIARFSPVFTIPQMVFGTGVVAALLGLTFVALPFPAPREAHGFTVREALKVVTYPGVLLFAIILFFQTANEQAITTFTSKWLGAAGAPPNIATYALAGYQAGMMSGRVMVGALLRRANKLRVVLAAGVFGTIACATLWLSNSPVVKACSVFAVGLAFAPVYQTVLAIAGDRHRRFAGSVFGALFSIGLLGGVAAPMTIALVSERFGIQAGPVVPTISVAILAALTVVAIRGEVRGR